MGLSYRFDSEVMLCDGHYRDFAYCFGNDAFTSISAVT